MNRKYGKYEIRSAIFFTAALVYWCFVLFAFAYLAEVLDLKKDQQAALLMGSIWIIGTAVFLILGIVNLVRARTNHPQAAVPMVIVPQPRPQQQPRPQPVRSYINHMTERQMLENLITKLKAGEINNIPWVYTYLTSQDPSIVRYAATTLANYVDTMDPKYLIKFDEQFRSCTSVEWSINWSLVDISQMESIIGDEKTQAAMRGSIQNIDAIIRASDGIMVARGDMGVEIPLEEVPALQKMIIKKTYQAGKIVITATQMLDSMISHPRPTRAEATDVANAIYDGTSAIMLSGETAMGAYPVEAVTVMDRIARRTEQDINYSSRLRERKISRHDNVTDAVSHSACMMAADLEASEIMTVTMSGRTAHMVSKYRPSAPIIAGCPKEKVWRQMSLCWGVSAVHIEEKDEAEALFAHAVQCAKDAKLVSEGDQVILTAGLPLGMSGTTNLIRVIMA